MHPTVKAFGDDLRAKINGGHQLSGQKVERPSFWIEVTKGGSGYFAVMLWDGDGYAEPWETGEGRYGEPEPAMCEARSWAENQIQQNQEPGHEQ